MAPLRVLVIEGDPQTRAVLSGLLERLGHEVQLASNGLDSLLRLHAFRPDVAMVDLSMPGLDGFAIARRIRAALGVASPVLVAYAADTHGPVRAAAQEAGFDHCVPKPSSIEDLMGVLQRPLEAVG